MGAIPKEKRDKRYTWADYLQWPDDERWEVIDGVAYNMTPSLLAKHQIAAGNFYFILRKKLAGKPCMPFMAPLDVYLDESNFVQPDVFVVCDPTKIKDRVHGAPDLAVEVISPATSLKDKRGKKGLYQGFGVREYVIVYPEEMFVERYGLKGKKFQEPEILGMEDILVLSSLGGVEIPVKEIFDGIKGETI